MRTQASNHNSGALPLDFSVEELQLPAPRELTEIIDADITDSISTAAPISPISSPISFPISGEQQLEEIAGEPRQMSEERRHIRHPRARRSSALIVMALSAICGVIGGIVISKAGNLPIWTTVFEEKPFGSIFLERSLLGAAFLAVEFVLGFFAMGDLLVWSVPLFAGVSLALRVAVTEKWILLPSSILLLLVVAFGAAVSAGLSETLMSIARGGTVHLGNSPRKVFLLNFLGYLAAAVACALYEGIILNV